jgi:DNA polymerase
MIYLDTETYSATPIAHGTYRYLADAEVMVLTWAVDAGPVQLWDVTESVQVPQAFIDALADPAHEVTAHNAMFDRNTRLLKPIIHSNRWRCLMVRALSHGLPGSLDLLCQIFKVGETDAKQAEIGRRLIQLFCKPLPKNSKLRRATRHTHPAEWEQFKEYARSDIRAMQALDKVLPRWNDDWPMYHLDQRINDRGLPVDAPLANAIVEAAKQEKDVLAARTHELTDGNVGSTTQRDALLAHLIESYGVDLPDMQASTLERRLNDPELPPECRELIANRLAASNTSVSKFASVVRGVSADGRLRGTLQFCGAARTRRWSGRTFQPQNLPRPASKQPEIEMFIEAFEAGVIDHVAPDVMGAARDCVRAVIAAPPGRKFCVADLANIEGRDAAWLAGEDWKLDAFRAYDAGTGPDLYRVAYAAAFNIPVEDVTSDQRQVGKVMELMLQYEGGVGAFLTGAANYRVDLDAMARAALPLIPDDVMAEATKMWAWCVDTKRPTYGLSATVFTACDSLKRLWRRRHPRIVQMWADLRSGFEQATYQHNTDIPVGRLVFRRVDNWLRILMPSGKFLCYPAPRVSPDGVLSYMGINQYTRKWERLTTYGGKLFENLCQAFAGDILKANMPAVDDNGYEIVLTVHDEIVTETPDTDQYTAARLAELMAAVPDYAEGLPLAAAGYESKRYKKG